MGLRGTLKLATMAKDAKLGMSSSVSYIAKAQTHLHGFRSLALGYRSFAAIFTGNEANVPRRHSKGTVIAHSLHIRYIVTYWQNTNKQHKTISSPLSAIGTNSNFTMRYTALITALLVSLAAASAVPRFEGPAEVGLEGRQTSDCSKCVNHVKTCVVCVETHCSTEKLKC
jgi:hypothetical protein